MLLVGNAAAGRGQGRLRSMAVRPGREGGAGRGGRRRGGRGAPATGPGPVAARLPPPPPFLSTRFRSLRAHQVLDGRLFQELLRRLELGAVCGGETGGGKGRGGGGGGEPASVSGRAGPNRPALRRRPADAAGRAASPRFPPPRPFPATAHALPGPGGPPPPPPPPPQGDTRPPPRRAYPPSPFPSLRPPPSAPYPARPSSPGW